MADTVQVDLIVNALARGLDNLEKVANAGLEIGAAIEKGAKKADKSLGDLGKKAEGFTDRFEKDMRSFNDKVDIVSFAIEGMGQAIEITAAAAERLGRTEFKTALDKMTESAQDLGDALFELPIGKLIPAFQVLGDEELKNADAITILTRAFTGAGDAAKLFNVQLIKMKAESGEISWEEATQQINELTGAMEDNRTEASKSADAINAYAARWKGIASTVSTTANDNLQRWLAANGREAKAAAAELEALEKTSKLLAAGLSGVVGNALQENATTTAETGAEIARLKDEIALAEEKANNAAKAYGEGSKYTQDLRDDVANLNGELQTQVEKQSAVEEATKKTIAQFILQQVAASLDARGQLELASALGLIDQQSYATANAAMILTATYDKNHDGAVSAEEGATKYIEALKRLSDSVSQETNPALNQNTLSLSSNEAHVNMLAEEWETAIPIQQDWRQSIIDAEASMGSAVVTGGELKTTIDSIQSKDVVINTIYNTTGTPPSGGGSSNQGSQVFAAHGIDMIVPPGYHENFRVNVSSGERVTVQTPQQQAAGMGGGFSIGVVNIYAPPGANGATIAQDFSAEIARLARQYQSAGMSALGG